MTIGKLRIVVPVLLFLFMLSELTMHAALVSIETTDESGAEFKDALVIVKSLETGGEVFRSLTDATGMVPTRDLTSGLYRVIATCPYGTCITKISEFLVADQPVELRLVLKYRPIINTVPLGLQIMRLRIVDAQSRVVESALVNVRDSEAHENKWYRTNLSGEVEIELPRRRPVIFVVVYNDKVTERTITNSTLERTIVSGNRLEISLD